MSTLGKVETRIYYASPNLVIMDCPYNGEPALVLKTLEGEGEMSSALKMCGMELKGDWEFRGDGLKFWYLKKKGGGDGKEVPVSISGKGVNS